MRPVLSLLGLATLIVITVAGSAPCRADQPAYFGGEAAMTGASNMALVRAGGAAWYNPAGLGGMAPNRFDVTGSAFVLRVRDLSPVLHSELPSGKQNMEALSTETIPIPSALVYHLRFTERWTGALAVLVTQSDSFAIRGEVESLERYPGHLNDVLMTGRANISFQGQTYRIGPVFAAEVNPRLRLGFGSFVIYGEIKDSSHLMIIAEDQDGTATPSLAVMQHLTQRRLSWFGGQITAGLQWQVNAGLHLGFVIRSPVLSFSRLGETVQSGQAVSSGSAFPGDQFVYTDVPIQASAEGVMIEPAAFTLGLAYRFERFWLGIESDLQLPLELELFQTSYALTWNIRAGGRFWIGEKYSLGFGIFTDRSPKRTVNWIADQAADYYGAVIGFEFRSVYALQSEPRPRQLVLSTTISLRYAAGPAKLGGMFYQPQAATMDEFARLELETREVVFHTLSLQLSANLSF